jgi:hypothetical protein
METLFPFARVRGEIKCGEETGMKTMAALLALVAGIFQIVGCNSGWSESLVSGTGRLDSGHRGNPAGEFLLLPNLGLAWRKSVLLRNQGERAIQWKVETFDRDGNKIGEIGPGSHLPAGDAQTIPAEWIPPQAAFLRLTATGSLISRVLLESKDGIRSESLQALTEAATELAFPAFVENDAADRKLSLLNPGAAAANAFAIGHSRDGREIFRTPIASLASFECRSVSLSELFPSGSIFEVAMVQVFSDAPLLGMQFFDRLSADLAALPALSTLKPEWIVPVVRSANGHALWNRIGISNLSDVPTELRVEAVNEGRAARGSFHFIYLAARATIYWGPETDGMTTPDAVTRVRFTSGRPVSVYQVVGAIQGTGLAALPGDGGGGHRFEAASTRRGDALTLQPVVPRPAAPRRRFPFPGMDDRAAADNRH